MHMKDLSEQLDHAARCHDYYFKRLLDDCKLRASELDVLMFLAMHPDMRTAKDICDDRLVAKSLVSTSVDALVNRRLLAREADPCDRRRMLLTLLPDAEPIIARAKAMSEAFCAQICAEISAEELQTFERVLSQMRHNMDEIISAN